MSARTSQCVGYLCRSCDEICFCCWSLPQKILHVSFFFVIHSKMWYDSMSSVGTQEVFIRFTPKKTKNSFLVIFQRKSQGH